MAVYESRKPPSTPRQLERLIARLAVENGIVLNYGRAGLKTPKAPRIPDVPQEKGYAEGTWPWRRLMEECINYLTILSLTCEAVLVKSEKDNNYLRAAWSLSTKAASDALCVLQLCDRGFVPQASMVARSCIEAIEVLSAFTIKRDDADPFVAAQTPQDANLNWHRVQKKARRKMDAAFAEFVEIDKETLDWREENRRFLGAHIHPSFVAPMLNIHSKWENNAPAHPLMPARTKTCVRVFQPIADACFEFSALLQLSTRGRRGGIGKQDGPPIQGYENRGFFTENWLDSYATFGHQFIQQLWLMYIWHQKDPPFCDWRMDLTGTNEDGHVP